MQNDLISREFSVKALREYAEQKHTVGQTELANGILKAINFLQKEENVPTAYDVEKVVEQLENKSFIDIDEHYADNGERLILSREAVDIIRNG